jgi:transcriptional regulator with PAS, ATPase and Fis domain
MVTQCREGRAGWLRTPARLRQKPEAAADVPDKTLVTEDDAFQSVLAVARRAARSDATVLITGETGTGKELVAHLIHESSNRAGGPFVRVNCAALAEGVLESELFGHEQGAFTGAIRGRRGRFELAEDGTLFLDEIGDIPARTQVMLLRVLQEREIERVGGADSIAVNARIVSATHRNLPQLVRAGPFREDLYYRLNVVPIEVPPLRERPDDVERLTKHFIRKHARSSPPPSVGQEAIAHLLRHAWPGNVRELENMVQRALILAAGSELTLHDFRFDTWVEDHAPGKAAANAAPQVVGLRQEARQVERESCASCCSYTEATSRARREPLASRGPRCSVVRRSTVSCSRTQLRCPGKANRHTALGALGGSPAPSAQASAVLWAGRCSPRAASEG